VGDAANTRIRLVALDLRPPLAVRTIGPPLRTRAGRSAVLRFTLTVPATVRLQVRRGSRLVLAVRALRDAGADTLPFGRRLRPGRYRLVLTAADGDGRTATAAAGTLRVTT
jgi:hypothetical protein